jgi:hypothetical protein
MAYVYFRATACCGAKTARRSGECLENSRKIRGKPKPAPSRKRKSKPASTETTLKRRNTESGFGAALYEIGAYGQSIAASKIALDWCSSQKAPLRAHWANRPKEKGLAVSRKAFLNWMVGVTGIEPVTPTMST